MFKTSSHAETRNSIVKFAKVYILVTRKAEFGGVKELPTYRFKETQYHLTGDHSVPYIDTLFFSGLPLGVEKKNEGKEKERLNFPYIEGKRAVFFVI